MEPQYSITFTRDINSPLTRQMFRHRTALFRDKLGWDVSVNDAGEERDEYDTPFALYLILSDASGSHIASARFMRISQRCMTVNAFPGLFSRNMIEDADTAIEVTRFCVSDPMNAETVKQLFLESAHWIYGTQYTSFVGVFYAPMLRVYRRAGWSPKIINKKDGLYVGQWTKNKFDGNWDLLHSPLLI